MGATSLLRECRRMIASWWRADRIRVSRDEGRLLRLGPGAIVVIRGERFVVTERRAGAGRIHYVCRGETKEATLEVAVAADGVDPELIWRQDETCDDLDAADVEIFSGS